MIAYNMTALLGTLSGALDMVEHALLGATSNHAKRVACISVLLGRACGVDEDLLPDLAGCAMLHDSALTEYIQDEFQNGKPVLTDKNLIRLAPHCLAGERNAERLISAAGAKNAVLYHHEQADGNGPFGKSTEETPLLAQIIHLADQLDVTFDLSRTAAGKEEKMTAYLQENSGRLFSPELTEQMLLLLKNGGLYPFPAEGSRALLLRLLPGDKRFYSAKEVIRTATVFAGIIDDASSFTCRHSLGIAVKAKRMGAYYGWDEDTQAKLYFAGAVHDIGKLMIPNALLEKPGRLTETEYQAVQQHAQASYELLRALDEWKDVAAWAYCHHEKLDGSGYPFGKKGAELNEKERLLACLDIYQALVEPRPYKEGMPHEKAMAILKSMAEKNQLDAKIVSDIDCCFAEN